MDVEALWTFKDWFVDWFGTDGHFWLALLVGSLAYYLTPIIFCTIQTLHSGVDSEPVDAHYISLLRWLACIVFGLVSHVFVDWGVQLF